MQTADFNPQDFNHSGMAEADKSLLVKFEIKSRPDKLETEKQGRPIYKDVEYIDIKINGNRSGGACRPATPGDKARFPEHYSRFKTRAEVPMIGTPLSEWPQISRSQIDELAFVNCKTVEQLCNMSDSNLSQFMGGYSLRDKAKAWMESSSKSKLISEKLELKAKVDRLEAMVEKLSEDRGMSLVEESVAETSEKKAKAKAKKK